MAAETLNGKWKLNSSDKFDEYMKALGVGMALRKMGNLAKPDVTITIDGSSFQYKSVSTFRTSSFKCTIGEEFDEETPDSRKCKSKVTWEGGKLVQVQNWNGKTTTIIRFIDDNGDLINDCQMGDIICRRVYKKA